jgi:hypothetical protein
LDTVGLLWLGLPWMGLPSLVDRLLRVLQARSGPCVLRNRLRDNRLLLTPGVASPNSAFEPPFRDRYPGAAGSPLWRGDPAWRATD